METPPQNRLRPYLIDDPELPKGVTINVAPRFVPSGGTGPNNTVRLEVEVTHRHPGRALRWFIVGSTIFWLAIIASSVIGR